MNTELLKRNHKGEFCKIKPITCQEGYCNGCQIYLDWMRTVHGSITPEWLRKQEKEQECPELRKVGAGDEIGYFCKIADSRCLREYGYPCPEYDRIMKEMADETN